jgi:hypothetical protein
MEMSDDPNWIQGPDSLQDGFPASAYQAQLSIAVAGRGAGTEEL